MSEHVRLFVDGSWGDAEGGRTFDAFNPSTGESLGTVAEGGRADARRAIDAANRARPGWAALSAFDRAAAMERVAEAIDERRDQLARTLTLDQGKPLRAEAYDEVDELRAYFEMAAADARRMEGLMPPSVDANKRVLLYRVSRGVVSIISPWNWPYTMPAEILAPAIAYGNTVVWAPAPSTSVCAARLAECLEAAELPPGVVNMVTGPGPVVGDEIAANPGTQAVGFIGSIATGLSVAARAAGKELLLEMGGNGPLVVMDDADLDAAVTATLAACFLNAGQSCTAGERILIHSDVRDEYLGLLTAAIDKQVRIGDPLDDATTLGPLNNEPTAAKTERHVRDAVEHGAVVLAGGSRAPSHGSDLFYEATVLDGITADMEIAREETFGPVAPLFKFNTDAEAIAMANNTEFGLAAYFYGRDVRRVWRVAEALEYGIVGVNTGLISTEVAPFGGMKESGIGREGSKYGIEEYLEVKYICLGGI